MLEVVWESKLDNKYLVSVQRLARYKGVLEVHELDQLLYAETVTLSFDALFGPDCGDVQHWEEIAIKFIDARNAQIPDSN
jgi:hypothetical protein